MSEYSIEGETLDKNSLETTGEDSESGLNGRKRANDLDGATWTRYSISIWSDIRKTVEEQSLGHPAMFPVQLVERLLQSFTQREDDVILDPFCGSGSTLLAAQRLGRTGIGFEISSDYVQLTQKRLEAPQQIELFSAELPTSGKAQIFEEDARDILRYLAPDSVDMVITSPPYWDILSQRRTADGKEIRDYGDTRDDLGKIEDYRAFLEELAAVFRPVFRVMKPGKYCAVVVMDIRKKNRFYPFHSDLASLMQNLGFIYDDLIIWDRRHEYNNLRPLGYPAVFRINKCHEFILIFQKPKAK